ncbi:MAG: YdcF family protein [Clostridiales bacterium]|nr:YdcF family protein [Clostridia bacterium]MCR4563399.1 YdcF family protein [Clostridiales bacterium]
MEKKPFFKRKSVKIILAVILSLCVLSGVFAVFANVYIVQYAKQYILEYDELNQKNTDCIMVLGAGLWDGKPSPMLKERLDFGLEAFKSGCSEKMLMSGDHGTEFHDEVNAMKDYLAENGVDRDVIFLDHAGFSTYESMYRARDVFDVKSMVIVTQTYHLYRAVYDARKLGIEAYGYKAERLQYPALNYMREPLARIKDFIWCIIKPEPTFLGEEIPISGSAAATDDKTQV